MGDRTITLPRSELDQDPALKQCLEQFDRLRQEIVDEEYERQKLTHASMSMQAQLNRLGLKYAEQKYGDLMGNTETKTEKDSDDE
jgi:LPS O-antigen subunit length determinant protein (WzzB/FepE family)